VDIESGEAPEPAYAGVDISGVNRRLGCRIMQRQTKLTSYKEYLCMHLYEQYQKDQKSANDLWTSYDMQYNQSKFKMNRSFANDPALLDIEATEYVLP